MVPDVSPFPTNVHIWQKGCSACPSLCAGNVTVCMMSFLILFFLLLLSCTELGIAVAHNANGINFTLTDCRRMRDAAGDEANSVPKSKRAFHTQSAVPQCAVHKHCTGLPALLCRVCTV